MGTTTSNLSLYKPSIGEANWGTPLNNNLDTIDAELVRTCVFLTNNSGGTLSTGDVVVIDTTTDNAVTTTTKINDKKIAGVIVTGGANGATVKICINGVATVNVDSAVSRGDVLVSSNTAGSARTDNSPLAGAILGRALTSTTGAGVVTALITVE